MFIKSRVTAGILTVLTVSCNVALAERFLNVANKKIKVMVVDLQSEEEIKSFVLAPMSHKLLDLAQWKNGGVALVVKPMRTSYLLERKHDKGNLCEHCNQVVEMKCGCAKAPKKEKKNQAFEMAVSSKEMHALNEFIIVDAQEGMQVKVFGVKAGSEKE